MPDKVIIPIKRTSIYAGLATLSGVLKLKNNGVEIEYQKKDEIFRAFTSDAEVIFLLRLSKKI